MLTSDRNIISSGVCIRLDVTMWSARAKLRREDIPDADKLPPHELASLGSKKLFDTTRLRVFNTLKMRAWSLLDRSGARFMGGWLVSNTSNLDDLKYRLADIKRGFDQAVADFLVDYETGVRQWLEQFPQWRGILEAAMPAQTELARKYSFNWQMYTIGAECGSSNMDDMATGLADSALGEVRKMAMDIYRDTFKDTTRITKKSLRSLQPLCAKLDGVAFIHPQLQELSKLVESLVQDVNTDEDMSRNLLAVRALLLAMQQDDFFSAYVTPYDNGVKSSTDIIDSLIGGQQQPAGEAKSVEPDAGPAPLVFMHESAAEAHGTVAFAAPVMCGDAEMPALLDRAREILSETEPQPAGLLGLDSMGLW